MFGWFKKKKNVIPQKLRNLPHPPPLPTSPPVPLKNTTNYQKQESNSNDNDVVIPVVIGAIISDSYNNSSYDSGSSCDSCSCGCD
jgi:hypothetical protein